MIWRVFVICNWIGIVKSLHWLLVIVSAVRNERASVPLQAIELWRWRFWRRSLWWTLFWWSGSVSYRALRSRFISLIISYWNLCWVEVALGYLSGIIASFSFNRTLVLIILLNSYLLNVLLKLNCWLRPTSDVYRRRVVNLLRHIII